MGFFPYLYRNELNFPRFDGHVVKVYITFITKSAVGIKVNKGDDLREILENVFKKKKNGGD